MSSNEDEVNLKASIDQIASSTEHITHDGSPTPYWYAKDIYKTYKSIYPVGYTSMGDFARMLQNLSGYIYKPNVVSPEYGVLSPAWEYNENVVNNITNDRHKDTQKYDFLSESEDCDVYSRAESSKTSAAVTSSYKRQVDIQPTSYIRPKTKAYDSNEFKEPKKRLKHVGDTASFQGIKNMIVAAFYQGIVIPTGSLSTAVCKSSGVMFAYKTAPCDKYRHPHSSLTKYLLCCSDIVEVRNLISNYIINITPEAKKLAKRRAEMHSRINHSNPAILYSLERLAVNLFGCRSTVPIDDFLVLFKDIYGINFKAFTNMDTGRFINKQIKSPNFVATTTNKTPMVTCTPAFDDDYKCFGNEIIQESLYKMEKSCVTGLQAIETVVQTNLPVKSSELFKCQGLETLLAMADSNVPRCLQEPLCSYNMDELRMVELSPVWCYLQHPLFLDKQFLYLEEREL